MLDTQGGLASGAVARRAYDLAEALLRERHARDVGAHGEDVALIEPDLGEGDDPRIDALPHDPSWEVEPRWSRQDRASLEERVERLGPGLAAVRPAADVDERTGT